MLGRQLLVRRRGRREESLHVLGRRVHECLRARSRLREHVQRWALHPRVRRGRHVPQHVQRRTLHVPLRGRLLHQHVQRQRLHRRAHPRRAGDTCGHIHEHACALLRATGAHACEPDGVTVARPDSVAFRRPARVRRASRDERRRRARERSNPVSGRPRRRRCYDPSMSRASRSSACVVLSIALWSALAAASGCLSASSSTGTSADANAPTDALAPTECHGGGACSPIGSGCSTSDGSVECVCCSTLDAHYPVDCKVELDAGPAGHWVCGI